VRPRDVGLNHLVDLVEEHLTEELDITGLAELRLPIEPA
jgi:hypothetical protein